jgi:Sec-independent protein translocase protein TatA
VEGTAIIIILAIAGVASALLFAIKGILDQLPDVFDSFRRARDAWKRLKEEQDEAAKPDDTEEPLPPVTVSADDEQEPPAAA